MLVVDPREVYPLSYKEHQETSSSRRKVHTSEYVQSSIGCMRSKVGQEASVSAKGWTSDQISLGHMGNREKGGMRVSSCPSRVGLALTYLRLDPHVLSLRALP